MVEFDVESMRVISEPKILVNGGVDISKKPIWIEGPHIYKVNGTYYLTAAEGGTAENHSQTIFKSQNVFGPYIPYEKNPILTQKNLDPNRKNPVTCTGHADFVQTDDGNWWAVFLGCRPYEGNNYNTGRETFLAPVKWIVGSEGTGWPVINSEYQAVQFSYPLPIIPTTEKVDIPYSGNFNVKDEFDKQELHPSWIFLRTPHEKWYDLNSKPGWLSIKLRTETCSGKMNPSFIARRQQHATGTVITSLVFNPTAENEKAGLVVFLNETHFYFLCKSLFNGEPVIQLFKSSDNTDSENEIELISVSKIDERRIAQPLNLKIEADKNVYSFYYSYEDTDWLLLKDSLDAAFLSVRIPRDFTGCVYAMYATSLGKPSNSIASYDWFEYSGKDEVYNEILKGNPYE
jgi:alpha-N-arabinofuranosidase